MKTKFVGHLALITSILAFGFSCGSDGKKSSSQNTNEELPAHNNATVPEPTLSESPRVENSTLIIRYQHPMNNVTFKCKVKYNGNEGQENSCAVLGELRVDVSKKGQYDIYIRAVKNNGASSKPLHVSYKSEGTGGDDDYYPPIQDDCYGKKNQQSQGKFQEDCNPDQKDKGKNPGQHGPIQKGPGQQDPGQNYPCYNNIQSPCQVDDKNDDGKKDDNHQSTGYCYNPTTGQHDRICNWKK